MKRILNHLATDWYKYLLELIVITAGVLGAFALNSWNEEKKSIQKGYDILIDIRENVESNTIQFEEDIEINGQVINSIDIILENITVTKVYHDSIGRHLRFASWWAGSIFKSSGYEALIFHGADIVQSKELREAIIDLYEISYPEIVENTRLSEGNWMAVLPNWLELIERDPSNYDSPTQHRARPFDYQELVNSRMFRSILTFIRSQRVLDNQLRKAAIEKNQELIKLIDKELE